MRSYRSDLYDWLHPEPKPQPLTDEAFVQARWAEIAEKNHQKKLDLLVGLIQVVFALGAMIFLGIIGAAVMVWALRTLGW